MTHPNNNPHLVAARARKAADMIRNYVAARAEEDTPGHVIADELDLLADLWLMDVEAAACQYNAAEAVQAGRLKACSAATFEQAIKVAQAKANMLREAHAAVTRGRQERAAR